MSCCGLWCHLLQRRKVRISVLHGGAALVVHVTDVPTPHRAFYCACNPAGLCAYAPRVRLDATAHAVSPEELEGLLRERCPGAASDYDAARAEAEDLL
eukprot:gene1191-7746_t